MVKQGKIINFIANILKKKSGMYHWVHIHRIADRVKEARKELQLPIPSSHMSKPSEGNFTTYRDEDIETFKKNLVKWLGEVKK